MQFKDHIKKDKPKVYLIQEIPGTSKGEPKYNILGAQKYVVLNLILWERKNTVK